MISATEMLGGSGHVPRENFEMIYAIWCVLMFYFEQIKSIKSNIFYYKKIDYSTHLATLLLWVTLP